MGDAKRRKLLCNSYRLEPHCSKQTIEVVGLPDTAKLQISSELKKYWATLDPIPSKRLHKLIDTVKDSNGGIIVNLIDTHAVGNPSDLITKVFSKIPDLPATAITEMDEILANYDSETELVVISCLPPELPHSIARLLEKHTVLYIVTYKYCFENIYN